jgi:hypothetical protein
MNSGMTLAAALVLTATAAAAQERRLVITPTQHEKTTVEAVAQLAPARVPVEARIVKDAPYSAEVVTERVQVLPDGNRIVQKNTGRVYRDSQGRMRREDDVESGQPVSIMITDPVAGASFSLDPATRTAWKTPAGVTRVMVAKIKEGSAADPAEIERRRQVEAEIAHAREAELQHATTAPHVSGGVVGPVHKAAVADIKTEKLPARQLDGLTVEGTRTTHTIPAGAIGNEQPIVTVTEQWRSPELQVLVMTKTSDPRTGEATYRLQNIVRGEQSRSWFEVPGDYTIKETGIRRKPEMK